MVSPERGRGGTRGAPKLGLTAIGVEINEGYAETCAKRLSQEVFSFEPPAPEPEQMELPK